MASSSSEAVLEQLEEGVEALSEATGRRIKRPMCTFVSIAFCVTFFFAAGGPVTVRASPAVTGRLPHIIADLSGVASCRHC